MAVLDTPCEGSALERQVCKGLAHCNTMELSRVYPCGIHKYTHTTKKRQRCAMLERRIEKKKCCQVWQNISVTRLRGVSRGMCIRHNHLTSREQGYLVAVRQHKLHTSQVLNPRKITCRCERLLLLSQHVTD